jgi:acetyl esterase/lipase
MVRAVCACREVETCIHARLVAPGTRNQRAQHCKLHHSCASLQLSHISSKSYLLLSLTLAHSPCVRADPATRFEFWHYRHPVGPIMAAAPPPPSPLAIAMAASLARSLASDLTTTIMSSLRPLSLKNVLVWRDIPYISGSPHPKHRLDVYLPASPFPRPLGPVLLFVHGGAWARGDRVHNGPLYGNVGVAAAHAGCVCVVPSYRLTPEVRHPSHLEDVAAAAAWTYRNARRYGGDPRKIVFAGHSAGAHLAALAALQPHWIRKALSAAGASPPDEHSDLGLPRAFVGLSGVYDLPRLGSAAPVGDSIVHPAFGDEPGGWASASPVHAATRHSPVGQGKMPMLLLNAEEDFHLQQDAEELDEALAAAHGAGKGREGSGGGDEAAGGSAASAMMGGPPRRQNPTTASAGDAQGGVEVPVTLKAAAPPGPEIASTVETGAGSPAAATTGAKSASAVLSASGSAASAHRVRWMKPHAPFVRRGVVEGTNHLTIVGGIGQPGDLATDAMFAFIRDAVATKEGRRGEGGGRTWGQEQEERRSG